MSSIRTILSAVVEAGVVAAGELRTSDKLLVASLVNGTSGNAPEDVILFFVADTAGTMTLWQGNDLDDFAALPAVPPATTRVIRSQFAMVADVPQTQVVNVTAPIVMAQYENGGAPGTDLRVWVAVRFR